MSGHTLSLVYTAGRGAGTVTSLMTMELGTVGHRSSVLSVSLDRTLISLTFGNSRCVDLVSLFKDISLYFLGYLIVRSVLELEFL